ATLDKVKAKLKQQRPLVRKYWVLASDFESLFKSGDAIIGAGWPLMTNDLRKAGMNVGEVLPKEGVTGWSDSLMISTKAKHPICAAGSGSCSGRPCSGSSSSTSSPSSCCS